MGAYPSGKVLSAFYFANVGCFVQFYPNMLNILNRSLKKAWPHKRVTVSCVADFAL